MSAKSEESGWKRFDLFWKPASDARVTTSTGGAVTLVTLTFLSWLILYETYNFLSVHETESISVDHSFGERMNVNIDMLFPSTPCTFVNFDVVDSTGDEQIGVHDTLKKTNIPSKWSKSKQGCHVNGKLFLNKVAGNFHFALGRGVPNTAIGTSMSTDPFRRKKVGAGHQHRFSLIELHMFNTSHVIERLSFGEEYPGMPRQPLDGSVRNIANGIAQFNYYLTVVPTIYRYQSGREIKTYQQSFSEKVVHVESTARAFPHPGCFFFVELSPLQVVIQQDKLAFSTWLTNLCAIIGGYWVLSRSLEALLEQLANTIAPLKQ